MRPSKYTKEFKEQTVKLVLEQGQSVAKTAEDLGMSQSTLDKWVRQFRELKADPKALTKSQLDELKRLRREVQLLKMERDLLKKQQFTLPRLRQAVSNDCGTSK